MRIKFAFFALMLVGIVHAQQDAQYTQYMYNTINVNPAYAGSRDALSVFLMHRSQWIGLDGAPVTNNVSINTPIGDNRIGFGLSIVNDRIGISDDNTISADVSYTIKISANHKLAFGLKTTVNLLNVNFNRLTVRPGDTPTIGQYNINNRFTPNFGAGIYYHSDKSYLGFSVPGFLETKHYDDNTTSVASEKMHIYFIGGYVFELSGNLKFKPALLTKMVNGAPLQVDMSGNFLINDKFNLGLAGRWNASCSAVAGFQISDSWFVGYGYDFETTKLANYNSGSHEIFLRYELFRAYEKIVSPRFF
jgi:type IX secretion system PorP/SprF family membrane protein